MYSYFKMIVLSGSLFMPVAVSAQDRDNPERRQNDEHSRRYEDRSHKDFHEWNEREDQAYRRYLQEHHKKYHDFTRARKREQDDYWVWRHNHPDNDRR